MTLRRRFVVYLVALHLALAGAAVALAWVSTWATLAVEAVLAISLAIALMLVRQSQLPREQSRTALALIRSGEFTTRLVDTGVPEVDALIAAYNTMSADLRAQRVRLEEQQWFLEKIVAASPSGIATLDLDGRIAAANPAAIRWLGGNPAAVVGARIDDLPGTFGRSLAGLVPGATRLVEESGLRKFRCRLSEFIDRGTRRRFLLIEDLSEELHRSERSAFETSIRVMAHEINNSVGASNSLLESCRAYMIDLRPEHRQELGRALSLVISRGEHLNAFLNRFADVFRLPEPRLETVDLAKLVSDTARLMQAGASPDLTWSLELSGAPWPIRADRFQLEQVLINVIRNAREAVGARGIISFVRASSDGGDRLEIADTGPGIDPSVLPRLFSPFFSTKATGQGIGLTMTREILTAHGFRFGLENRHPVGALFWVSPANDAINSDTSPVQTPAGRLLP